MDNDKILREQEVLNLIGCSSPTLRRMEKIGSFPFRRKIGLRSIGWLQSEVLVWINTRRTAVSEKKEPRKAGSK